MSSVKREFERFVQWLAQRNVHADVRRLTNGIAQNFEQIALTGTARGERARTIVDLLGQKLGDLDEALPAPVALPRAIDIPWTRLKQLEVGPFRGFHRPEPLNLNKRVVLVYGPNGTGKSSLCEALEFALTGSVSEASAKRIDDADYCTNAYAESFAVPRLVASDMAGTEHVVTSNADAFRFCIIEKNRIDEFSRINARTPREQARSIAALFGIGHFDQFVANFNESLDSHLDLVGRRAKELADRRNAVQGASELLASATERRNNLDAAEAILAREFDAAFSFDQLRDWIGDGLHTGRLVELTHLLDQPAPQRISLMPGSVTALREDMESSSRRKHEISEQLAARKSDISYKQIYEAVSALRDRSPDHCPACDTPLDAVVRNPYEKAGNALAALADLAALEVAQSRLTDELLLLSRSLANVLKTSVSLAGPHLPIDERLRELIAGLPNEPTVSSWQELANARIGDTAFWNAVDDLLARIATHNANVEADANRRAELRQERTRLQNFRERLILQDAARSELEAALKDAERRISEFDVQNQELIAAAAAESPLIAGNLRLKTAYDAFVGVIREYRDRLPGTLLAGLNELARDLYNAFNRDDHATDKLTDLRLPTAPDEPLQIAFASEPDRRLDALHVLSEGHIRCLGLSILAAKIVQQGCPIMIFDDAVNAIDDDHRNGICKTIFEDAWLKDVQIVLTCHGEEFIKSIQRDLGADSVRHDSMLYVFGPHQGDRHLNIDTKPRTRNYVLLAREALDRLEIREALTQSRKALEGQIDRLWRWLSDRGRGELKLIFKRHGAFSELRDRAQALHKDLTAQQFAHEKKAPLLEALNALLGINAGSLEWTYLNAGTHEADRGEFDRAVVRTVVEAIEALDRALSSK